MKQQFWIIVILGPHPIVCLDPNYTKVKTESDKFHDHVFIISLHSCHIGKEWTVYCVYIWKIQCMWRLKCSYFQEIESRK